MSSLIVSANIAKQIKANKTKMYRQFRLGPYCIDKNRIIVGEMINHVRISDYYVLQSFSPVMSLCIKLQKNYTVSNHQKVKQGIFLFLLTEKKLNHLISSNSNIFNK